MLTIWFYYPEMFGSMLKHCRQSCKQCRPWSDLGLHFLLRLSVPRFGVTRVILLIDHHFIFFVHGSRFLPIVLDIYTLKGVTALCQNNECHFKGFVFENSQPLVFSFYYLLYSAIFLSFDKFHFQ